MFLIIDVTLPLIPGQGERMTIFLQMNSDYTVIEFLGRIHPLITIHPKRIPRVSRSETVLDKNPINLVDCTDVKVSVDSADFQVNIPIGGHRIESYTHRLVLHLVCVYLDCEFSPVEVDRGYVLGFIEVEQDFIL